MFRKLKHFIKKHLVLIIIVVVALIGTATALFLYNDSVNKTIARDEAATKTRLIAVNSAIAEVKAVKAAKAAAELKAKQEAAAKEVAEQSKTATLQTSNTLNSSACNTSTTHNNPASIDVIVNKKHCLQPLSFIPASLVDIDSNGFKLMPEAAAQFSLMSQAAAAADVPIGVSSSYRSYSTQITTYNYWVSISGKEGADTYSARPGYSEHQTGLAVDVKAGDKTLSDFLVTPQYTWMQAHAAEYGFIQRYPGDKQAITGYKTEEWHYRFVGVAVAQDMKARNVTTLEEYWDMSGGDY